MGKKNDRKCKERNTIQTRISPRALIGYLRYDRDNQVTAETDILNYFGCSREEFEKAVRGCKHRVNMGSQRTFVGLPRDSERCWSVGQVKPSQACSPPAQPSRIAPSTIRPSRAGTSPIRPSSYACSPQAQSSRVAPSTNRPSRMEISPIKPSSSGPKPPEAPPPKELIHEHAMLQETCNVYMTARCYT